MTRTCVYFFAILCRLWGCQKQQLTTIVSLWDISYTSFDVQRTIRTSDEGGWRRRRHLHLIETSVHVYSYLRTCTATKRALYASLFLIFKKLIDKTRSIWKMLDPFTTASRLTPIQQMSLAVLSRAACASMSTTTTTTTTMRDRGDRYGPMEWAQQVCNPWCPMRNRQ